MAADIKGVFKENQKLFLSILGILVLAIFMSSTSSKDGGFFSFWSLNTRNNGNTNGNSNGNNNPINSNNSGAVNTGKNNKYSSAPEMSLEQNTDYSATIVTSMGNIQIDLYEELTPETVNNFVFLSKDKFYDGVSIHRVIANFVIQGGDPLGTGFGGPGYAFEDEVLTSLTFKPFVVAMANSGPDTNGSQFFITTRFSNTASLNGDYTIFGQVTSGFDVIDKIELVDTNSDTDRPLSPILINTIQIEEDKSL